MVVENNSVNVLIDWSVMDLMLNYHYYYLEVLDKQQDDEMLKEIDQQQVYCLILVQHYSMMNWNWHWELMNPWLYFHRLFVEIFLMLHDELEKGMGNEWIVNCLTSFRGFAFLFAIFCSSIFKPNLDESNNHFSFSNQWSNRGKRNKCHGWLTRLFSLSQCRCNLSIFVRLLVIISLILSCVFMSKNESSQIIDSISTSYRN